MLGSPWTPLPKFRPWDPSKRAGSDPQNPGLTSAPSAIFTPDTTDNDSFANCALGDCKIPEEFSCVEPGGPPVLLKLRKSSNNLGRTLEASQLQVYDTPSLTPRNIWLDCKRDVLKMISDASRSPLDLISDILDPSQDEHEQYRSRWFSSARRSKLSDLLDSIFAHPKGRDLMLKWMQPHAMDSICSTVSSEMDLVTKELSLPSVEHITPDFISNWSLERIIEPATWLCLSLVRILEAAAQTGEAKRKNKIKSPKTVRSYFCSSYTSTYMWLGLRCSGFPACVSAVKPVPQVSIRLWAFSLEYQIIEEDNRCPLSLWPFHLVRQHRKAFMPIKSALYWACKTNHALSAYVLLRQHQYQLFDLCGTAGCCHPCESPIWDFRDTL